MKRYALLPFVLPSFVEGALYFALAHVLFLAEGGSFDKENWAFTMTWRPWFARRWRYSTTLGYCIGYHPSAGDRIHQHEPVHVRQVEDMLLLSFTVGLVVGWAGCHSFWWFLSIWCSGVAWQLPNFLTAWLRGGDPYRDSEHEKSAYAQSDRNTPAGMSWLDTH